MAKKVLKRGKQIKERNQTGVEDTHAIEYTLTEALDIFLSA
ncbi:hypothetical protein [Bacillus sp. ISL-34]|nr:hypothetical protein [Bacillus sp. ISL-34]